MFKEWIDGGDFDGATVFEHARSLGLEGIVSKRKYSRYVSGRSPHWLKMKNPASEAAPAVKREAEEDWGKIDSDALTSKVEPRRPDVAETTGRWTP